MYGVVHLPRAVVMMQLQVTGEQKTKRACTCSVELDALAHSLRVSVRPFSVGGKAFYLICARRRRRQMILLIGEQEGLFLARARCMGEPPATPLDPSPRPAHTADANPLSSTNWPQTYHQPRVNKKPRLHPPNHENGSKPLFTSAKSRRTKFMAGG